MNNTIRPIHTERCCVCGEEFDRLRMKEIFTGRTKYMCMECYRTGSAKVTAMNRDWKSTPRGKQLIAIAEKNK